jgi:hypothetical protein
LDQLNHVVLRGPASRVADALVHGRAARVIDSLDVLVELESVFRRIDTPARSSGKQQSCPVLRFEVGIGSGLDQSSHHFDMVCPRRNQERRLLSDDGTKTCHFGGRIPRVRICALRKQLLYKVHGAALRRHVQRRVPCFVHYFRISASVQKLHCRFCAAVGYSKREDLCLVRQRIIRIRSRLQKPLDGWRGIF